jgi:hypothetical protein
MVTMTEAARGQTLELHVILAIGSSDDYSWRAREFEHGPLHRTQTRRIEMFDHFNQRGSVVTFETSVVIHQRPVNQAHAVALPLRHPFESQAIRGPFKRPMRDVDSDDFVEGFFFQEGRQ